MNDSAHPAASRLDKRVVVELFALSFVSLLAELLIIRWMSCEIRAFSIYKNFPLIACFIGLGYGFVKAHSPAKLFQRFPLLLFILIVLISTSDITHLSQMMMMTTREAFADSQSVFQQSLLFRLLSLGGFVTLMLITAGVFAGIGQRIGQLFDELPPLQAYLINIAASALGIATFAGLSCLYMPPVGWLIFAVVPCFWVFRSNKAALLTLATTLLIAPVLQYLSAAPGWQVVWSPYYRIAYGPLYVPLPNNQLKSIGYSIAVNKAFFQQAFNFQPQFLKALNSADVNKIADDYDLAYRLFKPKSVLLLGAGSGNDASAALRAGVDKVSCVEIDPLVLAIGRRVHPEQPYSSPKVSVYVNDARAFLRRNTDKFDLVSTGVLDSHTAVGNSQSVRLDDYVYTVEGLTDLVKHMSAGGNVSLAWSYASRNDWLGKRMLLNLKLALRNVGLPDSVIVLKNDHTGVWHFLAPVTPQLTAAAKSLSVPGYYSDLTNMNLASIRPSTDDWPYLYMSTQTFDPMYLAVNAMMLLGCWIFCSKDIRAHASYSRWHFFCLGAGFLLAELTIIDRLALIFGSTWIVNSIGILSIMAAIFLSNLLVLRKPKVLTINQAYVALAVALLLGYILPLEQMALTTGLSGSLAAVALFAMPVFFAGIIFSKSFAAEKEPSVGLAFNVLGSMIGGLLEYSAVYTGIRSLVLLALVFYAAGWLLTRQSSQQEQKAVSLGSA